MFDRDGPTLWELAEQALSSTDRGYDLLAPKFDATPFRTPDWILDVVAKEIGAPGSVSRLLDVCCGTGAGIRALRPLCRDGVVGIDRSRGMLEEAARRLADAPGNAPVQLVRGDALSMPFEGAFDVAVSFGAFGHILEADEGRFVKQIARALRSGGRFVFVTGRRPPAYHPTRVVAEAFNLAMRVRNALLSPPFIMYYLTFVLPDVIFLLEQHGFRVELRHGLFPAPFSGAVVVMATKGGEAAGPSAPEAPNPSAPGAAGPST